MHDELKVLIDLQREQNALLKKYLWRLRFSLLSLLLLTTATAVGLGILVYKLPPAGPSGPTGALRFYATPTPATPSRSQSWTLDGAPPPPPSPAAAPR